jgi:hypothetical protein
MPSAATRSFSTQSACTRSGNNSSTTRLEERELAVTQVNRELKKPILYVSERSRAAAASSAAGCEDVAVRKRRFGKTARRALIVLVVSLSGIWIWGLLNDQAPPGQEERAVSEHDAPLRSEGAEVRASGRATTESSEALEAPVETLTMVEELEATSETDSDSCAEMSQLLATSNTEIYFAPGVEIDEQACAIAVRRLSGARMPALPDLPGFEIRDLSENSPANRLANEPDNPAWARAMEGRILEEVSNRLDFPVNMLHAVCRSTMCGVLFAYSTASHTGANRNEFAQRVADSLQFSGYLAGETLGGLTGFTYIYLGDWEMNRSAVPPRDMPATFEEFLQR